MKHANKNRHLKHRLLAGATLLAGLAISSTSFAGNYGGNCVPWQLHSYGGEAGVRTLDNPGDFRRTSGHASGKFCGNGSVRVEISKRHQGTGVVLIAGGYEYHFGQGDRGNRHENHWFRKYVTVNLPYQQHYNDGYSNHGYGNKHYKKHHNKRPKRYRDQDYYDDGYGYQGHYDKPRHHAKRHHKKHGHKRSHKRYNYVDHPNHSHGHGIARKPRLRIGSKIHRKAHRLNLPHRHKKAHYAYH